MHEPLLIITDADASVRCWGLMYLHVIATVVGVKEEMGEGVTITL